MNPVTLKTPNKKLSDALSLSRLKNASIFGALSDSGIQFLLGQGKLHTFEKDDEIFAYGDKGNSFYVVLEGELDFYKQHDSKKRLTRTIHFGEAIGFVSMIALHQRVGSLVAVKSGILVEVSSDVFSDFHDRHPFDFGILLMNLARDMGRTIRELSNALVENDVAINKQSLK